ncbi:hypothetical protein [Mycobacterium spongiae]|uniref:HpcH/HpaI aldolase/citrate lyase domain-containing protein n=1 Tax=Mycobacterium spongiae TaxID=886343 RepID=A0A975JVE0_9MYCO|nr:hypothetical protein [Mycobacterium spongiae]QUR66407.1 hypothetical protein F6B93_04275 [Mycobacterium spongiae]
MTTTTIVRLRQILCADTTVFSSAVLESTDPALPAVAADIGVDFLWFNMENTSFGLRDIRESIRMRNHGSVVSVVRIPHVGATQLPGKIIDFGAVSVAAPGVCSVREAHASVTPVST